MSWHKGTLAAWDLETTGTDIETDRIVTSSRWIIDPAKGTKVHAGWLVDPGIEIPEGAAAIHGITTEHARAHGQSASSAVREIAGDLLYWTVDQGVPVIAFNGQYDISLLHRECLRHGHRLEAAGLTAIKPVVDPFVMDKALSYRRGKRKLVDVARHYGIELTEADAHGSAADSLAAARVAYVIAERYPHIGRMPVEELHALQIEWKAEQAKSLQKYLRRKDPDAVCPPEWPLVPVPAQIQEQLR